ncbi:MAG: diguanylate cyclase [Armatimonadota bacterium]
MAFRLVLALAVVAWSWYASPLQQLVTGIAGGLLLLTAAKPKGRPAACLDVLAVSVLQAYSPAWLPLSAWVISIHRRYARSVAILLTPAPFLYAWRADGGFLWWAVLSGGVWLYLGFALAEQPAGNEEGALLLPLPDDLREQWEQEREAHRQLRYQYQELVGAHRELIAQQQAEHTRIHILRAALLAGDVGEVAQRICFMLCEHTGVGEAAIWMFERYRSALRLLHPRHTNLPVHIPLSLSSRSQESDLSFRAALNQFKSALQPSQGNRVEAFLLCDEQGIVGGVALFGWGHPEEEAGIRERFQQMQGVVALALRHAMQWNTLWQENRTWRALYEIGRLFLTSSSVEDSARKFISAVSELLSAPFVTLYLRQQDTDAFQIVASVGEPIRLMEQEGKAEGGIAAWIAQQARPLYVPRTSTEPKLIGHTSKRIFASLIGAPLSVRGRVEGVLLVAHPTTGYFDEHHVEQVVSAVNQFAQVIEVSRLTRSVGLLALTDGLTGVFNRRYMEVRLDEEIHRSQRYGKRFSLILVDVDHFKQVNDTWGHATGDMVLQEVSRRLVENLRETEMVFRYGGEEFLVILPETALQQATVVAQRLCDAVRKHPFHTLGGATVFRVTLSAGVAEYPTHGSDKVTLLAAADQALYLAKRRGRNRVEQLPDAA